MPRWIAPLVLVVAIIAAYASSLRAVFFFDDNLAIVENPTIRDLARLDKVLILPGAEAGTVGGRPIANLTLAINYAISGTDPWSYHAFNLLVHIAAALALWGILRRTVERTPCREAPGPRASRLAFVIALLWALHPLQTEAVTYVVQRVESLMGLFFLLTLYCFVRAVDSPTPRRWYVFSFVACLIGVGCKEVIVTAPLVVFLYDRTFVAGSWREAWRRRRGYHVALLSTWIPLVLLAAGTHGRGGAAGFGTDVPWWAYAFTQCQAIVHYLRLVFWPHPLVFDYGTLVIRDFTAIAPQAVFLLLLAGATVWALVRKPVLGFVGACFFLILAPSSSIVPIATQTMAEHRMYLPLAAVIALVVLGAHRLAGARVAVAFAALAIGAGWLTFQRNNVYASELSLWQDTAKHRPQNFRAHTTLGFLFLQAGRLPEAIAEFETSLKLEPDNAATHLDLSAALLRAGENAEAVEHAEAAVRLDPDNSNAQINLANALISLGRTDAAIEHYTVALQQQPDQPDVHVALGNALLDSGKADAAIEHFRMALRLTPENAQTWCALARALVAHGDSSTARRACEKALKLQPDLPEAFFILGNLDAADRNFASAIARYRRAVALAPEYTAAQNNLANALLVSGQVDEAIAEYRALLQRRPDDRSLQENLEQALRLQRSARP